jgi:hypothetical protein
MVHSTQLDPIGLAGGLNLYGFAGGDPVNYSDPFGLKVDLSQLTPSQRRAIRALRQSSSVFNEWYNAVDEWSGTMVVRNPTNEAEQSLIATTQGFTWRGRTDGTMLLGSGGSMEFDALVAHEFAHAASGLEGGTPSKCYATGTKEESEECASQEQNKVHRQIGLRDRKNYADEGPYTKPKDSEPKKP